jgi:hypothetical protein
MFDSRRLAEGNTNNKKMADDDDEARVQQKGANAELQDDDQQQQQQQQQPWLHSSCCNKAPQHHSQPKPSKRASSPNPKSYCHFFYLKKQLDNGFINEFGNIRASFSQIL